MLLHLQKDKSETQLLESVVKGTRQEQQGREKETEAVAAKRSTEG